MHPEQAQGAQQRPHPLRELGARADEERRLAGAPRGAEDQVAVQRAAPGRPGQVLLHRGPPQPRLGDDLVELPDQRRLGQRGQLGKGCADRVGPERPAVERRSRDGMAEQVVEQGALVGRQLLG
jgi:hypothetical protein